MTTDRRTFLKVAAGAAASAGAFAAAMYARGPARALYVRLMRPQIGPPIEDPPGAEVLYNGIALPSPWPPYQRTLDRHPEEPPYLLHPPAVVPIDVGRQLFVDDFLVEECELDRSYHAAEYVDANPVLTPATEWDKRDEPAERTNIPPRPSAMPFSDGVWFDPSDGQFKLWYTAGYGRATCYAESADGLAWHRPALDVVPGTNIVLNEPRDSTTVWLDHEEPNPRMRFKLSMFRSDGRRLWHYASPDGIHWTPAGFGGPSGDRSTMFYNAFRKVWVHSLRQSDDMAQNLGRHRRYYESRRFSSIAPWTQDQAVAWVGADDLDRPRVELGTPPELYNLDCVAYESVLLGLFSMYFGDPRGRHKPNHIAVGFSRDGFHWSRPSREPFVGVSERAGDWNWTNVQSAGGCCVVMGDWLRFYVSGRAGAPGSESAGVCSTGVATLRRDGFVSLDATTDRLPRAAGFTPRPRSITTRPVKFSGSRLFVNAAIDGGELRAEVIDGDGRPIDRFAASRCTPVAGDSTRAAVTWSGGASLADLANQPVRFRFHLRGGRLYSFWVAADDRGASRGYVAAGGPEFTGATDG